MNGEEKMRLTLIYDRSLRSRHELGYVASMRLHGVNVVVILLDEVTNEPMVCKETIEVDGNIVEVPPGKFREVALSIPQKRCGGREIPAYLYF
ncbi:MAG: hypothetical protein QW290_10125 [Sulfolobales archaeon]